MKMVRRLFGFAFLGMAVWMVTPLLPLGYDLPLYAVLALVLAIDRLRTRTRARSAKTAASALGLVTAAGLLGLTWNGMGIGSASARISISSQVPAGSPLTFSETRTGGQLVKEIASAGRKPILIYVTADWCVTCRTIERSVLPDPEVVAALKGTKLVKLDVTKFGDDTKAVLKQLNAAGPPTMVFLDEARREVAGTRLVGSVTVASLTRSALRAASQ